MDKYIDYDLSFEEAAIVLMRSLPKDADEDVKEAFQMARQALLDEGGRHEWTLLSEAMPWKLEYVWITTAAGDVHPAYLDVNEDWRLMDGGLGIGGVVAWMPMLPPEAHRGWGPEEDDDGE